MPPAAFTSTGPAAGAAGSCAGAAAVAAAAGAAVGAAAGALAVGAPAPPEAPQAARISAPRPPAALAFRKWRRVNRPDIRSSEPLVAIVTSLRICCRGRTQAIGRHVPGL